MRNLKIAVKLVLGFGAIIALLVVVATVSAINLQKSSDSIDILGDRYLKITNSLWQLRRDMVSLERYMYKAMATPGLDETKKYIDDADDTANEISKSFTEIQPLYKGDPKNITDIKDSLSQLKPLHEQAGRLMLEGKDDEAYAVLTNQYVPLFEQAYNKITIVFDEVQARASETTLDAKESSTFAVRFILIITLICFIVAAVVTFLITISIKKPIAELEAAAKDLAMGRFTATINYSSKDELGSLSDNMRTAMTMMSDSISNIDLTSDQVSMGASQISGVSQTLAQGATEQASSIEELSSSISEVASQVKQNADNASIAHDISLKATSEIVNSNEQMQNLMKQMNNIHTKSMEINKIIKVIEDIAFQTNILALNAAVEAARAGQAGRGFAVVADEVRNLAAKSAEAAKSTTALIEDSVSSVSAGVELADVTAHNLLTVVGSVKETTTLVSDIKHASDNQSNAVSQIIIALNQISAVVQNNSATSEESAAASEELSNQANKLKRLIASFVLKNSYNTSYNNELLVYSPTKKIEQTKMQADDDFDNKY